MGSKVMKTLCKDARVHFKKKKKKTDSGYCKLENIYFLEVL